MRKVRRLKNPIPATPEAWLVEIAAAYQDARDAIPFGPYVGESFGEKELFHLAPAVTLKFRGLPRSARQLGKATEAALSSYVATRDADARSLDDAHLAFAFCYVASHYGLGFLDEVQAERLMDYVDHHRRSLARFINRGTKANKDLQPTAAGATMRRRRLKSSVRRKASTGMTE